MKSATNRYKVQHKIEDDPFICMWGGIICSRWWLPSAFWRIWKTQMKRWTRRVWRTAPLSLFSDQFSLLHREAWLDLFITYNNFLPSLVAVERFFSMGFDILRPKKSSLSSDNSHMLECTREKHALKHKRIKILLRQWHLINNLR